MTTKGQNEHSPNPAVPEGGPAVESVKTVEEAAAAATKRESEKALAESSRSGSEPRPAGDSPKPHGDKFASTSGKTARDDPSAEGKP